MSNKIVYFVPYHTGYAQIEYVKSFSYFGDVYLFVYKWNSWRKLVEQYFVESTKIKVYEMNIENVLKQIKEEESKGNRIVVLTTASSNYGLGGHSCRLFDLIQEYFPSIIDVYSTGHCLYGCQSCDHSNSHQLAFTFTNYIRTKDFPSDSFERFAQIVVCPSYSSEQFPFSFLSNKQIISTILSFSFDYLIKVHPLIYPSEYREHPLFDFSQTERESVDLLVQSGRTIDEKQTNTLRLIENARVIICDFDSSIPFECLYFDDEKFVFVYETIEQSSKEDDRRQFFHCFTTSDELIHLFDLYFQNKLPSKTKLSRQFFLEKYIEPDGNELEHLAQIRHWNEFPLQLSSISLDQLQQVKQEIRQRFIVDSSPIPFLAMGEYPPVCFSNK